MSNTKNKNMNVKQQLRRRATERNYRRQRGFNMEPLEPRVLLSATPPRLVGIQPNLGDLLQHGDVLNIAPEQLTFRFDKNQIIDGQTLDGISIERSQDDDFSNATTITPGYLAVGDQSNQVIMRFAEPLPDAFYRIEIIGNGFNALANIEDCLFDADPDVEGNQNLALEFELDLGAQIIAVVPQPTSRTSDGGLTQADDQIVVYFNNDDLDPALAQDPSFYQLIETRETVSNQDNPQPISPVSVVYDPANDTSTLTFAADIQDLTSSTGTWRFRIGDREPIPAPPTLMKATGDAGETFDSASALGIIDDDSQVISASIDPQMFLATYPGANTDPGSRDIPYITERQVDFSRDTRDGVTAIPYNFQLEYGSDPEGSTLFNQINETQKQRAREAFELWSAYSGVEFVESDVAGITIALGDLRAVSPFETGGRGDQAYMKYILDPTFVDSLVVLDSAEQWEDSFGDNSIPGGSESFFRWVMAGIGNAIGLGAANNLVGPTIMATERPTTFDRVAVEELYPGPLDIMHVTHVYRPDSVDIDLYEFELDEAGLFRAETIAQRLDDASLLNSALSLYRQHTNGDRELIARNDDYFSEDSFIEISLEPGIYFIGVSSTGNTDYNPNTANSGSGGTTQGRYDLRLDFEPKINNVIRDATGVAIDGDADGIAGGTYNFWFRTDADPIYVDKTAVAGGSGSINRPFNNIPDAFSAAQPGDVVRIVGNGGADGNLSTVGDNLSYEIGFNLINRPLADGSSMDIPKGVTVMVDAGAVFKLGRSTINVGSSSPEVNRSKSALQILGTPDQSVFFTSFDDETIGADTNTALSTTPVQGDWGGIKFRNDVDRGEDRFEYELEGIFLNYVNHADLQYGGGQVVIDSVQQVVTPIDMTDARPTVSHNKITFSADAAMAANPDSFEETTFNAPRFQSLPFTSDFIRIGPDIHGNVLIDNSTNALFVRVNTPAGNEVETLTVAGRWDDTDVVHIVAENLLIEGRPGGPMGQEIDGNPLRPAEDRFVMTARLDANLVIDPGIIVKLDGARLETGIGAQLIAEGTAGRNVVFTSIEDDRFGTGGTFDTRSDFSNTLAEPGDWAGIYFGHGSIGSIDHAFVAYGGGVAKIEGSFTGFNTVEIHQARVRVANSVFTNNLSGEGGQASANRFGRGPNGPGAIFSLGAQPVIVGNTITGTLGLADITDPTGSTRGLGPAISVDANSLSYHLVADPGRVRGFIGDRSQVRDNHGALIRDNTIEDNDLNGMVVRGTIVTTQSVWDDTGIVHLVLDEIIVPDVDTIGGLRLQSSPNESLVVKFEGANAGFTASGQPQDAIGRIGGTVQVLGQPGNPVILTSLHDDTQGAGFVTDTNANAELTLPNAGDWRGIVFDQFTNDRNVQVHVEQESVGASQRPDNNTASRAELLGNLANTLRGGDDNRRLGFEVHGQISQDSDVDVYSFEADGGTLVYVDIDRTSIGLDTVVELISSQGQVLAQSDSSAVEALERNKVGGDAGNAGIGLPLTDPDKIGDLFSTNPLDAGFRVFLPGTIGKLGTYHVRVRSASSDLSNIEGGQSSGGYQLQLRLQETDEIPGSTVQFADISYATTGIDIIGIPGNSPLIGDGAEDPNTNNSDFTTPLDLGNVTLTNNGMLSVSGSLESNNDVDYFQIEVEYENVDRVAPDERVSVVFDIDFADGLGRPETFLSVFEPDGTLILTSSRGNVSDDLPAPTTGGVVEVTRGSLGTNDAYIGPVQLRPGNYIVAVSSGTAPAEWVNAGSPTSLVRLEPLDSIERVAVEHFGNLPDPATAEPPQIPVLFGTSTFDSTLYTPNGSEIIDGEIITIETLAGQKATFEFDTEGFRLFPPNPADLVEGETISIQSLPIGFGFGADSQISVFRLNSTGFTVDLPVDVTDISDGDTITIVETTGLTTTYEFDDDFSFSPFNVSVFFSSDESVETIANRLVNTINGVGLSQAVGNGAQVQIPDAANVFGTGLNIDIISPVAGDEISVFFDPAQSRLEYADTLANAINSSGVAVATVIGAVEPVILLDSVQSVRLTRGGGMAGNSPVRATNVPVPYSSSDTPDTIGLALATAIEATLGEFGLSAFGGAEITLTDQSIGFLGTGGTTFTQQDTTPIVGLSPDSNFVFSRPGVVNFQLQDVPLYIVEGIGQTNNTVSTLSIFDGYSGQREVIVGPFGQHVGDLLVRTNNAGDDQLFAYQTSNNDFEVNDSTTSPYLQISTTNGATGAAGASNLATYIQEDPADPQSGTNVDMGGAGVVFEALTPAGFAVGSRGDSFFGRDPDPNDPNDPLRAAFRGNDYRSNIVYAIDTGNGAVDSQGNPRAGNVAYQGAGTDLVEVGHIDTFNDINNQTNTTLAVVEATGVGQFGGGTIRNITDGMELAVSTGGTTTTFEFDSGPDVTAITDPSFGQFITDGEFFLVDGTRYVFDTGAVLVISKSGAEFTDGETVTISDLLGRSRTYEFDSDGITTPGNLAVAFTAASPPTEIISGLVNAINNDVTFGVTATVLSNRISLTGDTSATTTAVNVDIEGDYGVGNPANDVVLATEESFMVDQIGAIVVAALRNNALVTASYDSGRINFLGATTANFDNVDTFIDSGAEAGIDTANDLAIGFLASDTAQAIAARITRAINDNSLGVASLSDATITLASGSAVNVVSRFQSTDAGFVIAGAPPGGRVTGVVSLDGGNGPTGNAANRLLAVTDTGGLFEFNLSTRESSYISSSTDLLTGSQGFGFGGGFGSAIQFAGLTKGPEMIQNGRYAQTLIGIDTSGVLYAFDEFGQFVPTFANGQAFVETNAFDPVGLGFSLQQENQWTVSGIRRNDAGVQYLAPPTESRREPANAGSALYFGVPANDIADRNYDRTSGTYGTVFSNTFSLADYTPDDEPFMYFDYFLDTEGTDYRPAANPPIPMRDSFRIYVADGSREINRGEWHLLATNDDFTSNIEYDEFDDPNIYDDINVDVQLLEDNVGWQQARISLADFAGSSDLRLRMDFSTAGGLSLGNDDFGLTGFGGVGGGGFGNFVPSQTPGLGGTEGTELRAVPATQIRDGQTISIGAFGGFFLGGGDFGTTLEFDKGFTLSPPAGNDITEGESFTIQAIGGQPVTFEFDTDGAVADGNVAVLTRNDMSAGGVAFAIRQAILTSDLGQPSVGENLFTADLTDESNDVIFNAIDSGIDPGASGVFTATGFIGDTPNAFDDDVDIIRVEMEAGDNIQVIVDTSAFAGNFQSLSPQIRVFNEDGVEQTAGQASFATGGTIARIDFTASVAGNYFVGVSDANNAFYDPLGGPGQFGGGGFGGNGEYEIEITSGGAQLTTYIDGSRLNVLGVSGIFQDAAEGETEPALFVDGSPGTSFGNTPITIHAGMSAQEVASAVEVALADAFSAGDDNWILRRDDMIKIVGRDIIDPGPLAKADHLWGDFTSAFLYEWLPPRYPNGPLRGLDNAHEGVYIDNLTIGFAERGEMVNEAPANTAFVTRPDIDPDTSITTGPYQLQIRTATNYGDPAGTAPFLRLGRSFDTNDRLTENGLTLEAPSGRELSNGQTFILQDDTGAVTFEYVDSTIDEANDTLATAAKSGLVGGTSNTYIGIGQMGHNAANGDNTNVLPGADVDLIELDLVAGDRVNVDVDAFNPDSEAIAAVPLDSYLRIFNDEGTQLFSAEDVPGPGDLDIRAYFFDPSVTFTAPADGKYYVGISQSGNSFYDPMVAGSGISPFKDELFRFPELRPTPIDSSDLLSPLLRSQTLPGGNYEVTITLNSGATAGDTVPVPFAAFDTPLNVANRVTRAINSRQAQKAVDLTADPRENTNMIDIHGSGVAVVSLAEGFDDESNDTLATANSTNAEIGRATNFRVRGVIGNNEDLTNPGLDVDLYRVDLQAGQRITVDVNALEYSSTLAPAATLLDDAGNPLSVSVDDPAVALEVEAIFRLIDPGTPSDRRLSGFDPLLRYIAPETGTYYVAISSANNVTTSVFNNLSTVNYDPFTPGSGLLTSQFQNVGNYEAFITVGDGGIEFEDGRFRGDSDALRPQGQIIVAANRIMNSAEFGIRSDATRDAVGYPFPGATQNLPEININRIVPGITITNNVIAHSGTGGILFSGNADVVGQQAGAVPFGRIINNTLVGGGVNGQTVNDTGIAVTENASPTLLNNIVAQFSVGVFVDATSDTTVIGGTLYQDNTVAAVTPSVALGFGDFPILLDPSDSLFVDPVADNYYIENRSQAIDSSVDSLPDRADLIDVRTQLGIPVSPILAPDFDVVGQLRIDDPNVQTPVGQGENVFKDRGALDRSDFTGPTANLVVPFDNAKGDQNPSEGNVATATKGLSSFVIELADRTLTGGVGIDDNSVGADSLTLQQGGLLLTEGLDYVFEYDPTSDLIRLRPLAGVWAPNESYVITMSNSVRDLAGNTLAPNQLSGETILTITSGLGSDFGDAPVPYPTRSVDDGARHNLEENFFLGAGVDADSDGEPASDANIDALDDGVLLSGIVVRDISNEVTVTASADGFLDAWVDWNQDGDWDDTGEQIFTRTALAAGDNVLMFSAADNVPFGETFARFRFSSSGGLDPTGVANDGEVEDYQIVVGANPWHNPVNSLDVNDDAQIAPLDVLLIINELDSFVFARPGDGRLPLPSTEEIFLDTNNDGFISPIDALLIINHLDILNRAAAAPLAAHAPVDASITASLPTFEPIPVMINTVVETRSKDTSARAEAIAELVQVDHEELPRRRNRAYRESVVVRRELTREPSAEWDRLVDQAWDLDDDLFTS